MILEPITIDGRHGTVLYIDDQWRPVASALATLASVTFDDGGSAFYAVESLKVAGDKPGHEFHGNQWTTSLSDLNILHDSIKDHAGRLANPSASATSHYSKQLERLHDGIQRHLKTHPIDDAYENNRLGRALDAANKLLNGKEPDSIDFDQALSNMHSVLASLSYQKPARYLAVRSEGPLHAAADANVPKVAVAVRYAFAKGRKALPDAALAILATEAALRDVLPQALEACMVAGGRAALGMLRVAGDYVGHPFHGNQWTDAFGTLDKYVYHISDPTIPLSSFEKSGIKPSTRGYDGPGVYMAHTPEKTQYYEELDKGRLFRIDKQKLIEKFGKYPAQENGVQYDDGTGEVILGGHRAIPREFIEVKHKDAWKALGGQTLRSNIHTLMSYVKGPTLRDRVKRLLGDKPGHEFHGNQWTTGGSGIMSSIGHVAYDGSIQTVDFTGQGKDVRDETPGNPVVGHLTEADIVEHSKLWPGRMGAPSQRFRAQPVEELGPGMRVQWLSTPSADDYFAVQDHYERKGVKIVDQFVSSTGLKSLDPRKLRGAEFNPDQPRDEHGQWTSGGDAITFHGSPALPDLKSRVASILKNGIIATQGGIGVSYSTSNREVAARYASRAVAFRSTKGKDASVVVFEVHIPKLAAVTTESDESFDLSHTVYKHEGSIPASWIKGAYEVTGDVRHGGKWTRVLESNEFFVTFLPVVFEKDTELVGLRTAAGPLRMKFNASNPRIKAAAKKQAYDLIKGITQTTKDWIREAVTAHAENELSDKEFYTAIRDVIGDDVRATMIARTETMRAVHAGQRESWDQAIDAGLLMGDEKRVWIATGDDVVCSECETLDGKEADMDGEYPGGYDSPPLHPACRCTESIA